MKEQKVGATESFGCNNRGDLDPMLNESQNHRMA